MSFPRYCAVDSAVDSVAEAVEDVSVCVPFLPASIILLAEFLSTVTPLPALRSIVRLNSMVSLLSSPFSTVETVGKSVKNVENSELQNCAGIDDEVSCDYFAEIVEN